MSSGGLPELFRRPGAATVALRPGNALQLATLQQQLGAWEQQHQQQPQLLQRCASQSTSSMQCASQHTLHQYLLIAVAAARRLEALLEGCSLTQGAAGHCSSSSAEWGDAQLELQAHRQVKRHERSYARAGPAR